MGNFFRRMLAFMLGIVFTITSIAGGLIGGAYYAYKNVNPIEILAPNDPEMEEALGDLYGASIEQLVDLIYDAMNSDDNYTFERLEEEYDLNLKALLEKMGVNLDNVDTSSSNGDWAALESISILSAISDPDKLLESIKLRSLYLLVPAFAEGKTIDDLLSKEAQAKLGDYTIAELLAADESTGELGVVTALKGLKIGALLPSIFEGKYDVDNRQYTYEVKQDGPVADLTFLNLVGNLNIKGIMDVVSGSNFMDEMISGDLSSLGATQIAEALGMIADVAGEETAEIIKKYTRVFGDTTIADLFAKNDDGSYIFVYENLVSNVEIGYLLGFDKSGDEWVNADGEQVSGLLEIVADLDIGEILHSDGDVVAMINAAVGDLSLTDVYETIFGTEEECPALIARLGTIKVSDILGDGADNIVPNLMESLRYALDGFTLRDAIYSFVDESVQEKIESIVILDAFLNIPMDELIRDEYTAADMIDIVNDAIGQLTIGEIIGVETDNELLALVYDYEIGGILNGVKAIIEGDNSFSVVIDEFLGQYLIGDIFGAALGYTYDEAEDNWGKDGKYVGEGLVPLLKMPVAKIAAIFDAESDFDIMDVVGGIQLGDIVYTALQIAGVDGILVEKETDERTIYVLGGDLADFEHLSQVILTLSVEEVYNNYADGEWWINRIGQIRAGDVLGYVLNNLVDIGITATFDGENWVAEGKYLLEVISNVLNTTAAGVYNAVKTGDANLILDKVFGTFGDTNLGDIVYMILDLAGVENFLVEKETDERPIYVVGDNLADFEHLSEVISTIEIYEIYKNYSDLDWWINRVGQINLGDGLAYVLNNLVDLGITATYNGEGWVAEGDYLTDVATNVLNTTTAGIYYAVKDGDFKSVAKKIVAKFGDTNLGEFAYAFASLIGKPYLVVRADNETGFAVGANYGDLVNITEPIFALSIKDIAYNYDEIDWWFDNLGEIKIGDALAFFINRYADGLKVVEDANGNWEVQGDFSAIFTSLFNITLNDFRNPDKVAFIKETFGGVKIGDLLDAFLKNVPEIMENPFIKAIREVTVLDIFDIAQADSMNGVFAKLQTIFYGVTFGDIPAIFGLEEAPFNVLAPLFDTKISNLFSALRSDTASGIKEFLLNMYGEFSIADAIDEFNFIPEDIRNNNFVNASLSLDVNAVYNMIDGGKDAVWNELIALYGATIEQDAVILKDIASIFYDGSDFDIPALAKIYAVELSDIFCAIRDNDITNFLRTSLGGITVGDIAEYFYSSNDNNFLEATYSFGVEDIITMIEAEGIEAKLDVLRNIYAGVTVEDAVYAFGGGETDNKALAKIYDTPITYFINLITVSDILGAIWGEFDDITLGDIIGNYVDTNGNNFLEASFTVSVDHVFRLLTAESVDDVIDIVNEIYGGITVGSLVGAFGVDDLGINALAKIYDTQLSFLVGLIASDDVLGDLRSEFGDIAIGDVAEHFYSSNDNNFLEATYSFGVEDIITMIEAEGIEAKLDVLRNIYAGVTVEDAVYAFGGGETDNKALAKIYDTPITYFINLITVSDILGAIWGEFDDITLGDIIGNYVDTNGNNFLEASFTVSVDHVFRLLTAESVDDVIDIVNEIYGGITVGSLVGAFGIDDLGINALAKIYDTQLSFLVGLIASDDVLGDLRSEFGDIAIGDIAEHFYSANDNNFLEATYSIDVEDIISMIEDGTTEGILDRVKDIYAGVTVGSLIGAFGVDDLGNEALAKIYDTSINFLLDLITTDDIVGDLRNEFGDITLADAIGDLVETSGNAFLEASFGISVEDGFKVAEAATLEDALNVVKTIYQGVVIGDVLDLFGLTDFDNEALAKIYDTRINFFVGLAETDDILGAIWGEFDDITLGDVMADFLPTNGNLFLEATYSFSVDNVFQLITAEDAGDMYDVVRSVYDGVTVGDFIRVFTPQELPMAAGDKIYGVKINDLITAFENNDLIEFFYRTFGDVTIGELFFLKEGSYTVLGCTVGYNTITGNWYVAEGTVGIEKPLEYLFNLTTGHIYDLAAAGELGLVRDEFAALFGDVTVGDIADNYYNNEEGIGAVEKLYGVKLADISNAIFNQDILDFGKEVLFDISLGDLVGWLLTAEINENTLVKALSAIDGFAIEEIVNAIGTNKVAYAIADLFITEDGQKAIVGNIGELAGLEECPLNVLENVYNAEIREIIIAIADGKIGDYLLDLVESISVGDIVADIEKATGDLGIDENNAFIAATFGFTVEDGIALAGSESTAELINSIKTIYEGVEVGDIVGVFGADDLGNAALAKIYDTPVNFLLGLATTDNILGAIWAEYEDITVGDAIGDLIDTNGNNFLDATLGISVDDVFNLVNCNGLEDVLDVVDGIYEGVDLGDVIGAFGVDDLGNAALAKIYDTTVDDITDFVVADDIVDELRAEYGDIAIIDAIGTYLPEDIVANEFISATLGFSVEDGFKVAEAEDAADIINIIKTVYEGVELGHVLDLFGVDDLGNAALAKIYDTPVNFFLGLATTDNILGAIWAEYEDITVGDAIGEYLPEDIVANEFISATLGISVDDVFNLVNCNGLEDVLDVVDGIYEGVDLSDIVAVIGVDDVDNAALAKILDTTIDDITDFVVADDIVDALRAEYGDIAIIDAIGEYLPEDIVANEFISATLGFSVEDGFKVAEAEGLEGILDVVDGIYEGVDLSDIVAVFGVDGVDNAALAKILDTTIDDITDFVVADDIVDALRAEYGDIAIGDAIGTYLPEDIVANEFISATLGFSVEDGFKVAEAEDTADIINIIKTVYEGVELGHVLDLFGVDDLGNAALAKIYDTPVNFFFGLATTDNILGAIWAEYEDITVGDAIGDLIDTNGNNFLGATLGISVDDVFNLVNCNGLEDVLDVVDSVYEGVNLGDIIGAFGVDDLGNAALAKIYDTTVDDITDFILTDDIVDALRAEYGDIAIIDAIGEYLPEDIVANEFISATLGFSVEDGFKVAEAEDLEGILDVVDGIYEGVDLGDIIAIFGVDDFGNAALAKIYDTTIDDITDFVLTDDIADALLTEFADITIGDAVSAYIPEDIGENALIAATYAISVEDVRNIIEGAALEDKLDVVYDIYDGVTVGDVVNLFYDGAVPVNALNTIYAVELVDVVDAIVNDEVIKYLYKTFGDVAIGDLFLDSANDYTMLGCDIVYNEETAEWEVADGELGIEDSLEYLLNLTLGRIYDIAASDDLTAELKQEVLAVVGDTTFGEIIDNVYDNERGIGILDTVYAIAIKDVVNALFDGTIADFGLDLAYGVSVDDLVGWLLAEDIANNNFVATTFSIDVENVIDFINEPENILTDLGEMYKDVYVSDIIDLIGVETEEDPALAELGTLSIGTVLTEASEGAYDTALETLKNAYELLPEDTQTIILVAGIGVGAVAGTILYFANNQLLGEIIDAVAGEDATWEEFLTNVGVTVESKGDNSLMKTFLAEGVKETFTTGYDFVGTYKNHITLGNALTAYLPAAEAIEEAIGMEFANCANGYKLDNEFANLSDRVLNLALGDFMTSDNKFVDSETAKEVLDAQFGDITVGDCLSYFVNTNGNWFMEKTFAITVADIKALIEGPETADRVALLQKLYDTVELGHVLGAVGVENPGIQAVTKIFDTELGFFFGLIGSEDIPADLIDELGDISIGDFMESFFVADGNKFLEATYAVDVEKIYEIVNAEDVINAVKTVYEGVTVGDVLALLGVTDSDNAALAKILDTEINFIIAITQVENVLGALWAEYDDITLGDAIANYLPTEGNEFLEATYTLGVDHVFQILNTDDFDGVSEILKTVYEGVTVADALELVGLTDYPIGALQTIAETPINFLLDLRADNYGGALYNQYGGLRIGDFLAPYGGEFALAGFTATHVEESDTWIVTSEAEVLETALTNLVNVTLADLYDLSKNLNKDGLLDFADKIIGETTVGEIAGLVYANEDPYIKAIDTVYGVEVMDVVDAAMNRNGMTLGGLVRAELGEITIGDCIPEGKITSTNDFVVATLSINVNDALHVYDNREDVLSAVLEVLEDTYANVQLSSLITPVANRTAGNVVGEVLNTVAADKIGEAYIGELFTDMLDNDLVAGVKKYVKDNFFGIAVGDVLGEAGSARAIGAWTVSNDALTGEWTAESEKGALDTVVTNVVNLTVEDIYDLSKNLNKDGLLDFADKIIGETTVGEIASLAYANEDPYIKAIDTVYGVEVMDVVDAAMTRNGMTLGGLVRAELGEITIGDCIPEGKITSTNDFVVATLSINVNDALHVYDNREDVLSAVLEVLEDTYANVQLSSLITPVANRTAGNVVGEVLNTVAADKIGEAYIGELFTDMLDNDLVAGVKKYVKDNFFDITLGDAVGTFIDEDIVANPFVAATLSVSAQTVLDVKNADGIGGKAQAFVALYDGVTVGDAVELIYDGDVPVNAINAVYAIEFVGLVDAIVDDQVIKYLYDTLGDVVVGDLFATSDYDMFGCSIGYNAETGEWVVADGELGIEGSIEYLLNLTLGRIYDIIASDDPIAELKQEALSVVGDMTVGDIAGRVYANDDPEIKAITTVYDILVADVLEAVFGMNDATIGGLLRAELGEIAIGDCIPEGKVTSTNDFVVATLSINVNDALHVYDNREDVLSAVLEVLEDTYANVQLSSLITPVANRTAGNVVGEVLNTVAADKIGEAYIGELFTDMLDNDLVAGVKKYVKDNFFDITLGDVAGAFLSEDTMAKPFVAATLSVSAQTVLDVIKADGMAGKAKAFLALYDGITVGDAASLVIKDVPDMKIIDMIYGLDINETACVFIDSGATALILHVFGETVFGDILGEIINGQSYIDVEVYYYVETGVYEVTAASLTEVIEAFLNFKINDFRKDIKGSIKTVIGDSTIGEYLTLVKEGWDNNQTLATIGTLKVIDILKVATGEMSAMQLIGDFRVEQLIGGYIPGGTDSKLASGVLAKAVLEMPIKNFSGLNKAKIFELFGEYTIGDALSSVVTLNKDTAGNWTKDGKLGNIITKVANFKLNIFEAGMMDGANEIMAVIYLGDALGYTEIDGKWYVQQTVSLNGATVENAYVPAIGVNGVIAAKNVKDIIDGGFDLNTLLGDLYLGELLGYYVADEVWYEYAKDDADNYKVVETADDNIYAYAGGTACAKLEATFSDIKVTDLLNGGIGTIMDQMDVLEIGYILGYTYDGGAWKKNGTEVTGITAKLAGYTVGQLTNGFDDIIDDWKIGEVLGYTYDSDAGKWYNGVNEVTGITAKLADYTVEDLTDGFDDIVNGWTLEDVLGDVSGNKILSLIAKEPISGITTAINKLTFGQIMGYAMKYTDANDNGVYDDGDTVLGWYQDVNGNGVVDTGETTSADELTAILCEYSVADISDSDFTSSLIKDIQNGVKVGTIFDGISDNALIKLMDPNWTIAELPTKLLGKFNGTADPLTIREMNTLGVFGNTLDDDALVKNIGKVINGNADDTWMNLSATVVLTKLLEAVAEMGSKL